MLFESLIILLTAIALNYATLYVNPNYHCTVEAEW
jgi:hypothetical protein